MARYIAAGAATLLLIAGGFLLWSSRTGAKEPIPPVPEQAAIVAERNTNVVPQPPAAPEKTREERRFARYDGNEDGSITRSEMMDTRRKAYAKLDVNGDGRLSFEEWAVATAEKFTKADADKSGALNRAEFLTTKRESKAVKCAC